MHPPLTASLLADVRQLITTADQRVTSAVIAELTLLYWHIGSALLQDQRVEYGK